MSWYKQEQVPEKLLSQWQQDINQVAPFLTEKKKNIKIRAKSIRVRGRCEIRSQLFKDLIGFMEKNMASEIPSQIECYMNVEKKVVEIDITLPYKYLGTFPQECHKLSIFTVNPDFESIRPRLIFFDMKHIVGFVPRGDHISFIKLKKLSDCINTPTTTTTPHHDVDISGSKASANTESTECQETQDRIDNDMRLDPLYCTGRHPFGCAMVDESPTTGIISSERGLIANPIVESGDPNIRDAPSDSTQNHRIDASDETRTREIPTSAANHHDQTDQHSVESRSDTQSTEYDGKSIDVGNQDSEKSSG
jgi:hypothetical protein